jgi:hypothetical protein
VSNAPIRVITTCTSRKAVGVVMLAERLYLGEQHRRLMDGVDQLRRQRPVEVWIISARAGVVAGHDLVGAYDESFRGLGRDDVRRRADALGIPQKLRVLASESQGLTLLLAGNEYFDAARLDEPMAWAAPAIALVSPRSAARLPRHPRLRAVAVGQAEAKRFSLPLTLLKGEIAKRLLLSLASSTNPATVVDPRFPLLDHVDREPVMALAS